MRGVSSAKTISSSFDADRKRWLMLALIFGAGFITIAMHDVFRWPMKLPGRHGLELMAMLLFVRCASTERYAATLAVLGGVAATAILGHGSGIESIVFLLQGLAIDLAYRMAKLNGWRALVLLPLLAGLVHTIKPLVKLGFMETVGIASDSLSAGLLYPVITHCIFGAVGGLFGVMAWQALQKTRQQSS